MYVSYNQSYNNIHAFVIHKLKRRATSWVVKNKINLSVSWIVLLIYRITSTFLLTFDTLEKFPKLYHHQLLLLSSVTPEYRVAWFENTSNNIGW